MLRRSFELEKPIRSARLYATALGAYRFWINGQPVGKQYLAPGWTDYREHVFYQTYDVTAAVVANGKNAIGALLGPRLVFDAARVVPAAQQLWQIPRPRCARSLRIEHDDGSVEWVNTDNQWYAAASHILSSELYDGETQEPRIKRLGQFFIRTCS